MHEVSVKHEAGCTTPNIKNLIKIWWIATLETDSSTKLFLIIQWWFFLFIIFKIKLCQTLESDGDDFWWILRAKLLQNLVCSVTWIISFFVKEHSSFKARSDATIIDHVNHPIQIQNTTARTRILARTILWARNKTYIITLLYQDSDKSCCKRSLLSTVLIRWMVRCASPLHYFLV